jgi:hypothetical protein
MKKIIFLFFLLLLILTGIALAPHLLQLERVRETVAEQLQDRFGSSVSTGRLQWDWLPVPHLSLRDTKITTDRVVCILPQTIIHPRWSSLFSKEISIKKIVLNHPRLRLIRTVGKNEKSDWSLPPTRIVVNNGVVTIDNDLETAGFSFSGPFQFTIKRGEIVLAGDWLKFDITASSTIANQLKILGKLDIAQNAYIARINCQGLQLHNVVTIAHGRIIPVDQEVDMTVHIAGTGLDTVTARLRGGFPSFIVKSEDAELLLNCGSSDLILAKNRDDFSVHINELELKEPGLTLSGTVERLLAESAADPRWHIDLRAKELDLSRIREGILTLWNKNVIVNEVLNIVLGGRARTASFQFDGPAANFHHLHTMTIAADVISAPIFVPEAELNLTDAHGAILIKDAILTGENLSASLGESRGRNCSLLLGLTGHGKPFRLDLDIDADLTPLPAILHRVVHHTGFSEELDRISNVRGSAVGHLSIGDTLDDPVVKITADNISVTMNYNRISWPIALHDGSFTLEPGRAGWQGVKGVVGPHLFDASSGTVTWGEGNTTRMTIDLPAATIDSAALFSELAANDFLPSSIKKNITRVQGMVDLQNGFLSGPARFPRQWVYHCNAKSKELQWERPDRTTSATLKNAVAFISNNKLTLNDSTLLSSGQSLNLSAQLTHSLLENWQGILTVDGTIDHAIGNWLRQKNWIPATYFPRLPCTLRKLKITWDKRPVEVAGTIIAGDGGQQKPMATIKLAAIGQTLVPEEIIFKNRDRRGHLTLAIAKMQPPGLRLTWEGELGVDTLQALLEYNPLSSGTLRGNFRLDTGSGPGISFLVGDLAADNLRWPCQHGKITIPAVLDLLVQGRDNRIDVKKLDLSLDANPLSLVGEATRSEKGLDVNLQLTAPRVSREDIRALLADLKDKASNFGINRSALPTTDKASPNWDMTGSVKFNIEHFFFTPEAASDDTPQEFVHALHPVRGRLVLTAGDHWYAQITQSRLCDINLSGVLYSDPVVGESSFDLSSPNPLLFQELLPCFGIEQNLVEGSFSLNGSLKGQPGNWSTGNLDFASSNGRILRMKLLARIFSLVNITDLFSPHDPSSIGQKGFRYTDLDLKTVIRDNRLFITKCVIKGEGLNLFAKGDMGLDTLDADFTVLVAPLKTIDAILGRIPLVGRAIGGKDAALVTIPVGIKGNIEDPQVTLLPPQAVSEGIVSLVQETLKLPFSILSPARPENQESAPAPIEPAR